MITEFLESLSPANTADRQTRVCDFFLFVSKGVKRPQDRCLGWLTAENDEDVRLYYYRFEEGVLEFRVTPQGDGDYQARVVDFITDLADLAEMLGDSAAVEV